MNLQSMIAYLITSLSKGSPSSKVSDFETVKGQIADPAAQRVFYMEIQLTAKTHGNIWVLDLSKVYPDRYAHPVYHAVCQQVYKEIENTRIYEILWDNTTVTYTGPIFNSWGNHE